MSANKFRHASLLILLALSALAQTGCQDAGPERAPIQGRVTVAGEPLAEGRILFVPIAPTEGPTTSATIADGAYQLSYDQGPVVGKHRVEIEAALQLGFELDDEAAFARRGGRRLPPNPIPAEFNCNSKLTVDVAADRENTFDVAIPRARASIASGR